MLRLVLPLAAILALSASTQQRGASIILSESDAKATAEQCSRSRPTFDGTWIPSNSDVNALEANWPKLQRLAPSGCCLGGVRVQEISSYDRQYVGLMVDGRRYIYINASAVGGGDTADPDRLKKPFRICDGGESFWGALYDPETETFSALAFNGRG